MDDCLFKPILLADLSAWLSSRFVSELPEALEEQSTPEMDLSGLEQYVGVDRTLLDHLVRELAVTNRSDRKKTAPGARQWQSPRSARFGASHQGECAYGPGGAFDRALRATGACHR